MKSNSNQTFNDFYNFLSKPSEIKNGKLVKWYTKMICKINPPKIRNKKRSGEDFLKFLGQPPEILNKDLVESAYKIIRDITPHYNNLKLFKS